jgi:type III secretion protein S
MDESRLLGLASEALVLALLLSLPAVITSAVIGLLISFVQAVTSLQEQSISQGFKLVAVALVLLLAGPWAGSLMLQFGRAVIQSMFA